jgi:membrane protease YdiL (CAAX protease family)
MQPNDSCAVSETPAPNKPQQIASWARLRGFLLIGAGTVVLGFLAQHSTGSQGAGAAGQLASHSQAIPIYLSVTLMDWALLYYCWVAVHHYGGNLETLSGGRWHSWKDIATDLAIAAPFWLLWNAAALGVHWLLGTGSDKTVDSLLPQSLLEIVIWIGTSLTAGICEELVFRGFLQRQFHALSGNLAVAVLLQGLVFGLFHSYQGWRNVVVISVLGILFGILAAWRRNLRANIMVHAWADIWEGWLKFVIWR